jgi:N4-gp56 family major capsid protein
MSLNTQLTSTSGVEDANVVFYDRVLLTWLKFALYLQESAEKRELPKANGKQIRFLRPNPLAAATTPLSEGNPTGTSGQSWVTTPILATPLQYGGYISFSDRLELEAYDNIVEQMHKILGYQASLTLDTLARIALTGNVTTYYTGGAVSEITTSTPVTALDIRKASIALRKIAVMPFENDLYHCVISPSTSGDIRADSTVGGFLDVNKFVSINSEHTKILRGEVGTLEGCRVQESQNILSGVGASSAVTWHNFTFGEQAFGSVDVDGMGIVKTMVQPTATAFDPLALAGTIGWKAYAVFPILDANRAVEVIGTSSY